MYVIVQEKNGEKMKKIIPNTVVECEEILKAS
jgi:hypothetical protein